LNVLQQNYCALVGVIKDCKKLSISKHSRGCEDNIRIDFNNGFFCNSLVIHNTSL